ncbi:MAG: MFS transporter [Acholeplasmatales bacterium]|nr:MFS transporter [Acholeplasmatales bacterium]
MEEIKEQNSTKKSPKLKLNTKNTLKIAFAFFGILMLWQVYNTYCPIILEALLKNKVDHLHYIIGIIMALDNVAAILIMPIFGKLSDKTNTKWGKRMPYLIIGMLLTIIVFPFIALMCMWNSLAGVIVFMMIFLVIMQSYRSPAVALMPDVTPKPLRSKANGLINLVGYMGGVLITVMGMLPFFKLNDESTLADVQSKVIWPFAISTIILVGVLLFLVITIKENKMVSEVQDSIDEGEKEIDLTEEIGENNKLSKTDKRNFIILLVAIFLWFMSFNSFETFGSLYFKDVVGDSTMYSTMATVLSVTSILSFIFFSTISNRIGRKWTIAIGLISLIVALAAIAIVSVIPGINFVTGTGKEARVTMGWKIFYIGMSAILGVGWALVNINSFPMAVEYSNKYNLGKFTSYYYISSMLAQSITPILVGLIMDFSDLGLRALFVYAAIVMGLSFVTFIFIKEKLKVKERLEKNKGEKKSALEILGEIDD